MSVEMCRLKELVGTGNTWPFLQLVYSESTPAESRSLCFLPQPTSTEVPSQTWAVVSMVHYDLTRWINAELGWKHFQYTPINLKRRPLGLARFRAMYTKKIRTIVFLSFFGKLSNFPVRGNWQASSIMYCLKPFCVESGVDGGDLNFTSSVHWSNRHQWLVTRLKYHIGEIFYLTKKWDGVNIGI